jgi:hypothetical protein
VQEAGLLAAPDLNTESLKPTMQPQLQLQIVPTSTETSCVPAPESIEDKTE